MSFVLYSELLGQLVELERGERQQKHHANLSIGRCGACRCCSACLGDAMAVHAGPDPLALLRAGDGTGGSRGGGLRSARSRPGTGQKLLLAVLSGS